MRKVVLAAAAAVLLGVLSAAPVVAQKGKGNDGVIPFNAQYPKLSVMWWQWALNQPIHDSADPTKAAHPLFNTVDTDPLGLTAANGQPVTGNVYFIGGCMGLLDADGNPVGAPAAVVRNITIKTGTRLFFPLWNVEMDNVGVDPPRTIEEIAVLAQQITEEYCDVASLYATIDGKPVANLGAFRTLSAPFIYTLPVLDDIYSFFGWTGFGGTSWDAVGDGYYLLLNPLPAGEHVVTFGGGGQDVTYHIKVKSGK